MDLSKKRKAEENGNSYPLHGVVVPDSAVANFSLPPPHLTISDVNKILEPLTLEQIVPILSAAVLHHPDILEAVRAVGDSDVQRRKLFVRGLGWETTTEKLKSVFSAFGELEEGIVITDKNTGKSKGYGFVTLKHIDGAVLALKEPNKKIDGRITVTQLAAAGNSNSADVASRKIYVGNIPFEISSDRLLSYFSSFGEIEEGPLGFDNQTGKSKGFAFFVYKTEDGARSSLAEPIKIVDGHQVVCKLATDNKKLKQPTPNMGPPGMIGMQNTGPAGMSNDGNFNVQGGGYGYGGPYQGGLAPGMQQQPQPQQPPVMSQPHMGGPGGPGGYGVHGPGYNVSGYGQAGAPYATPGGVTGEFGGPGGMNNAAGGYRMPGSTGYEGGQNYGTYPSQINQPGAGPRPPSGPYQGMGPYY